MDSFFLVHKNLYGTVFHPFRHSPFIRFSTLVKLGVRKEKTLSIRKAAAFRKTTKERTEMSNSNNNQINIPQAREAMDRFKMQAAQDEGVLFTS